jgi:hypothetical protein
MSLLTLRKKKKKKFLGISKEAKQSERTKRLGESVLSVLTAALRTEYQPGPTP